MTQTLPEHPAALPLCLSRRAEPDHQARMLAMEHRWLQALCDRLEDLADGLPGLPPAAERQALARDLTAVLPQHQARAVALLERLCSGSPCAPLGRVLLQRIRCQQGADAAHAQDVAAALRTPVAADTLGYMLRCFFDNSRRALAYEELAILALVGRHLSPATTALLLEG